RRKPQNEPLRRPPTQHLRRRRQSPLAEPHPSGYRRKVVPSTIDPQTRDTEMPSAATAYLVTRRDDGFGDVFPLTACHRYTMGRATTNRIVLKADLCSREHAEVYHADGRWCLRDLGSLNGTRVNNQALDSEWELAPGDDINLGRTNLIFVEDMSQLPDMPTGPKTGDSVN